MHRITKIATNDGNHFDSEKEARKYLEKKYGNQLTKIAHRILQQDKYTKLCEFLDENLDLFKELIELHNECNEKLTDDDN